MGPRVLPDPRPAVALAPAAEVVFVACCAAAGVGAAALVARWMGWR